MKKISLFPLLHSAYPAQMQQLMTMLQSQQIPHALCVSGATEAGQESVTQWTAQSLLCETPTDARACESCISCRLFAAGTHPDVIVLRPTKTASIGIEEAKQVRAHLIQSSSRPRIALIHQADALTTSAVNALLKIMEEPPAQRYLLFSTAALERIPATVRSRFQRIDLPVLSAAQLTQQLTERVEQLSSTMVSLDTLIEYSQGRFQRLLDLLNGTQSVEDMEELHQFIRTFFSAAIPVREEMLQRRFLKPKSDPNELAAFIDGCIASVHGLWKEQLMTGMEQPALTKKLTVLLHVQQLQKQHVNKKMICDYLTLSL